MLAVELENMESQLWVQQEASSKLFFSSSQEVVSEQSEKDELMGRLEAERIQLHADLQRCMYEIQQRDQYVQQVGTKV